MCEAGLTFDAALFDAHIRRVGLAISGGADSVALAHLVTPWCRERNIDVRILHVNHGWRGDASDADEAFVVALACQLNVPCHVTHLRKSDSPGVSAEMAARDARQTFFSESCALHQLDAIVTGHQADDVAETLLLRLLRGAGATGLSGLRPRSVLHGVTFLRPLLAHSHDALCAWLRDRNFAWHEDATNADETIPRNLIRQRVLPWLSDTLCHDVNKALQRSAEILREEDACLDAQTQNILREPLRVAELLPLPRALQRRVVRTMLLDKAGADAAGFDVVEHVLSALATPRWRFSVSGGEIVCDNGTLAFRRNHDAPGECVLRVPDDDTISEGSWGDLRVQLRRAPGIVRECGRIGELPAHASLSAAALRGHDVTVRAWRDGDRIQPLGMAGRRKLQDVLTDAKIPVWRKRNIPVFCCRGELIWIPGYRPAAAFAVTDAQDAIRVSCAHA